MTVAGFALAAGAVFGVSAPATALIPGWSSWPAVGLDACLYWKGQKMKQGYLTTACVPVNSTYYSFQYHR